MLDLYEAVKNCKLGAFLRTFENRIIISTLIFFKNYDESVALYIEPTDEENTYIISDCHSVTDYWETMYINPDDFKEQISKIGIKYPKPEMVKEVRKMTTLLLTPINGFLSLPHIAIIKTQIKQKIEENEKIKRKIIILAIILAISTLIEIIYMKDFQKGIIQMLNSK